MSYGSGTYGGFVYAGESIIGLSEPINVHVIPSATTALLIWDPPETGNPTGYRVRIDGGTPVDLGLVLSYEFTGLDDATSYDFEVMAFNDETESDWVLVTSSTIDNWSEIRINGGDPIVVGDDLCYLFEGLDPGTEYTVEVRTCNASCCSDWVSISIETLENRSSTCPCGAKWRVEACDLATGRVRAVLRPTAIDVQTTANGIGTGTLTFPIRDLRLRDVWPGLTSIYITYDGYPVGAFLTEKPSAGSGTVQIGLKSIEDYLNRRVVDNDLTYTGVQQTVIAQSLVAQAIPDGIPLTAQTLLSIHTRDRSYLAADTPFVWKLLQDLFDSENGPDYTLIHTKAAGAWSTSMLFEDESGRNSGLTLVGDIHGNYGLDVDSVDLTNYVFARGSGILATSDGTATSPYPRLDSVVDYGDTTDPVALQEQADGWEQSHNQPYALPSFIILGDDPDVSLLGLHDIARFKFSQGVATFDGEAKVIGITWTASPDQPLTRALTLVPVESVIDTVLNAVPTDPCPDC